jgi:hypothetical protein
MRRYQKTLSSIAGSAAARRLRVLLAVYQLADFCSGPFDIPLSMGQDFRHVLVAGAGTGCGRESLAALRKNHGALHAGYRAYCAISSLEHTR